MNVTFVFNFEENKKVEFSIPHIQCKIQKSAEKVVLSAFMVKLSKALASHSAGMSSNESKVKIIC
jgi:hypothetical protein